MTKIVPVTPKNLELFAEGANKFGLPRSLAWFKRTMFDPTVEDLTHDVCRGHMSVTETGEVVAVQGYYYQPCYYKQKKILGNTGCIMGADAAVGEELLCVLDANRETQEKGTLRFGNDLANKRSAKVCKVVHKMKPPPYRALECRVGLADMAAYPLTFLNRVNAPIWFRNCVWLACRPLSWLQRAARVAGKWAREEYVIESRVDFDEQEFGDFWLRFLAANDGVVSSREPTRLRWLFAESIKAGKVHLMVARKSAQVFGYAMIREFQTIGWAKEYEVIDICAVGNDTACLKALAKATLTVAQRHRGIKVLFFGWMPRQELWLDEIYKIRRECDHPFFMYRVNDQEIRESLALNKGWFFGPLDGERCMGRGGYIDL